MDNRGFNASYLEEEVVRQNKMKQNDGRIRVFSLQRVVRSSKATHSLPFD
jgi:hypothetical protein